MIKEDDIPENIYLLNIPPYTPELNPFEQMWQYIKACYKNQLFKNMVKLTEWMWNFVDNMKKDKIKSITSNKYYIDNFNVA